MKTTTLRMALGLSLLLAAGACKATTPTLPTERRTPEEPTPPTTGFRNLAAPAIYA